MFRTVFLVTLVLSLLSSAIAETTDPFAGKWKLDVRRSKYPAGTCPTTMVIEMKPLDQGVWYHSDATYKNGGQIHAQYTAGYDGKQVIVTGDRGLLLPVSLKRLDSHIVVASYSRGLQLVATSRRVVSRDGRLMTITTTSLDRSGKMVMTVGLYTRE